MIALAASTPGDASFRASGRGEWLPGARQPLLRILFSLLLVLGLAGCSPPPPTHGVGAMPDNAPARIATFAVSPSGDLVLLVRSDARATLVHLRSPLMSAVEGRWDSLARPEWAPQGETVAAVEVIGPRRRVAFWTVRGASLARVGPPGADGSSAFSRCSSVHWTREGDSVVYQVLQQLTMQDHFYVRLQTPGGPGQPLAVGSFHGIDQPVGRGQILVSGPVAGNAPTRVYALSRDRGERLEVAALAAGDTAAVSPDGDRVAVLRASGRGGSGSGSQQTTVEMLSLSGQRLETIALSGRYVGPLAWSPDASALALAEHRGGRLWPAVLDLALRTPSGLPDGRGAALAGRDPQWDRRGRLYCLTQDGVTRSRGIHSRCELVVPWPPANAAAGGR